MPATVALHRRSNRKQIRLQYRLRIAKIFAPAAGLRLRRSIGRVPRAPRRGGDSGFVLLRVARTDGRTGLSGGAIVGAALARACADLGLTCAAPTVADVSRVLARVAHRAFARLDLAHADWRARTHAGARGAGARTGPRRESGAAGRHLLLPSRAPQRLPVLGGASAPHVLLAYSSQPPRCYRRRHRRHPRRRCAP